MKMVDFKLIDKEHTTKSHVKSEIANVWRALCAITKRDNEKPSHLKPADNYVYHNKKGTYNIHSHNACSH